jgi:hypothetical protein
MTRGTSRWWLERLQAGDLPPEDARRIEEGLTAEERATLESLRASNQEILAAHPPAVLAAQIQRAVRRRETASLPKGPLFRIRPLLVMGSGMALAAAVLFVSVGQPRVRGDVADLPEVTRAKGLEPRLRVHWRTSSGEILVLSDRHALAAGDEVQLEYLVPEQMYGVIFSIDGRGAVTRHLPFDGDEAVLLTPGRAVSLDQSYRLDDAPRFERFFLVVSDRQFPLSVVEEALAQVASDGETAPLRLPEGVSYASWVARKVTP